MKKIILDSMKMFLFMTILTGILYPLFITVSGQFIFPLRANGSLIYRNGKVIGSEIIGQNFQKDIYFHGRPSGILYNPMPSGASNLAISSKILLHNMKFYENKFRNDNHLPDSVIVPSEMVFSSGSGVDPDVSKEAAFLQVPRICIARNFSAAESGIIYNLINSSAVKPQFGIFGNEVVNVLYLNLKLDELTR